MPQEVMKIASYLPWWVLNVLCGAIEAKKAYSD
jgi:hypothetical protein